MTGGAPPQPARRAPLTLLVTWGGSGLLPKMPGTWGSLAALPVAAPIHWAAGGLALALAAVIVAGLGFWALRHYLAGTERDDPQEVVIDEVAGQWLTLAPLALSPEAYLVGFLVFRAIDTVKPWPIRHLEALPGALGVMADDLAAGVVAAALCFGAFHLTGQV